MSRDEIREIAEIVGGDKTYTHFVHRINKEFEASDENRNANVYVLFQEVDDGEKVGFCVIGDSPVKMRIWEKTFKDEEWVPSDFVMGAPSYELMYMYIKPEYRGRGYGDKLFNRALDFAREKNVKAVYSYVSDRSPTGLEFYRRMNANILQDFSDDETSTAFLEWKL
jgi:GNAT superfamily N-acetyltransferase